MGYSSFAIGHCIYVPRNMDDEATQSYCTDDVETLPDSQGDSPAAAFSECHDTGPEPDDMEGTWIYEHEGGMQSVDTTNPGRYEEDAGALRLTPCWRRPLPEVLDEHTLADFLQVAGVPTWAVVDFGIHYYFREYSHSGDDREEEFGQIQTTVFGYDMRDTVAFFCTFLEGDTSEGFFEDLCIQIFWSLHAIQSPVLEIFLHETTANHAHEQSGSSTDMLSTPPPMQVAENMSTSTAVFLEHASASSNTNAIIDVLDSSESDSGADLYMDP